MKPLRRCIAVIGMSLLGATLLSSCGDDSTMLSIEFTLDHLSGDIDDAQRERLLSSRAVLATGEYEPRFAIPGINASIERCGLLSMPCIRKDQRSISIPPTAVNVQQHVVRFQIPLKAPGSSYRLESVQVKLPFEELQPKDFGPANLTFVRSSADWQPTQVAPVRIGTQVRALQGSVALNGAEFRVLSNHVDRLDGRRKPPYLFRQRHRLAGFGADGPTSAWYSVQLAQPRPAPLDRAEVYRARLAAAWVHAHWLEWIHIRARVDDACSGSDQNYELLMVDGDIVRFARWEGDAPPGQCRKRYTQMARGDDGGLIQYRSSETIAEAGSYDSQTSSRNWHAQCALMRSRVEHECDSPPPSANEVAAVEEEARRVRAWFPSAAALQEQARLQRKTP